MTGYNGNIKATKSDKDALEWQFSQVFGERMPGEEIQEGEAPCTSVYCVFIGVIRYLARRTAPRLCFQRRPWREWSSFIV